MRIITFLLLSIVFSNNSIGQFNVPSDSLKGWHLKDKTDDGYWGISLKKTYEFLASKKSVPVIVAVIDSGIDTLHEDLKDVLWKNPKEIPGNGIDDDGNGYIDDVHGWNFLGGKDGRNIEKASSEKARVYHSLKTKYENVKIDTAHLSTEEKFEYTLWKKAAAEITPNPENAMQLMMLKRVNERLQELDSVLRKYLKTNEYTTNEVEKAVFDNEAAKKAKMSYINLMQMLPLDKEVKNTFLLENLQDEVTKMQDEADAKENAPFNYREDIIKDDYNNLQDKFYGNNDVMGKGSMHGTHVSGIIAAKRNNQLGIDGVAENVKIMAIRAVPNGDEYDKDIALAIRYAVDNGAKVINMSFGKSFSPQKKWVDEAYEYAAKKDVLLIHAAGNDHMNIDSFYNFPSIQFLNGNTAQNVITVGASSDVKIANNYVAPFSNYGKQNVDVFAPGNQIYSTLPGKNNYGFLDGTSMASPVVAGLAALIRSYFPNLSAIQVKSVIEKSTSLCTSTTAVTKPGTEEIVAMKELCKTGGMVNAFQAAQMAESLTKLSRSKTIAVKKPIKKTNTKSTFTNLSVKQ